MASALALLLAAACGGSSSIQVSPQSNSAPTTAPIAAPASASPASASGATATTAKACSLFTNADVKAAIGLAVVKVDSLDNAGDSLCKYDLTDNGQLLVQIYSTRQAAVAATALEPASETISGLGDSAFWNFTTGLLFVHKGIRGLSITNPYAGAGGLTASQGESDAANVAARDAVVGLAMLAENKW